MAGYFIGMHRDLRMRKALLATVSSSEFSTMSLNSKLSKVVSYIQDKKAWEHGTCVKSRTSVSLSDQLHTLIDDDVDTGNSSLLSRSYDDLIMDIFVILA